MPATSAVDDDRAGRFRPRADLVLAAARGMNIIMWIAVGPIAYVLAAAYMRRGGLGVRGDIALGVAAAIAGGWMYCALGWQPPFAGVIGLALIGAGLILAVHRLFGWRGVAP